MTNQPKRHPGNSNLHLHHENSFQGLPVMTSYSPFIAEYLERLHETTQLALCAHRRVFAVRFDLRFPDHDLPLESDNTVISKFVDSLTVRIQSARERSKRLNGSAHQTQVRWCWVREIGREGRAHYHFVLLLNKDAYHTVGRFNSARENLYRRIQSAWASALEILVGEADGLVHIPVNAEYHLSQDDPAEMDRYFHRVSYLCKAATKMYGNRCRVFSCSRG
ncbi:inovirus Gp2 family protein [Pseudomonas sivasensis]|uniref:Inovirus Gp2 family protein n=1 Tax=Pseudomonas sivasensis TaxID=1880678 RepID=A0ABW8E8A9_9PSED